MILYRLNYDGGGSEESSDLDSLKVTREQIPGQIEAIDVRWNIVGDTSPGRTFEDHEAAMAEMYSLREDIYVDRSENVLEPQPEGLND